jgi:hypothetical protein
LADMMTVDFSVVFVPGKENGLADGLSRYPILGDSIYGNRQVPLLYHTNTIEQATEESQTVVTERPVHLTKQEGQGWVHHLRTVAMAREEAVGARRSTRVRKPITQPVVEDFRFSKRARLTQQEKQFVEETQVEQLVAEGPREEQKENSGAGRGPNRNDKAARRAIRTKIVNSKVSI